MYQPSATNNSSSDDDDIQRRFNELKRRKKLKSTNTDCKQSNNNLVAKLKTDCNGSGAEFKSKIRNSFFKSFFDPKNNENKSQDSSCNLAQRIQSAYDNLSKTEPNKKIEKEHKSEMNFEDSKTNGSNDSSADDVLFKESCLSKLCKQFPLYDSMDIQDALVKCNWSVTEAADNLNKLKERDTNSMIAKSSNVSHAVGKSLKRQKLEIYPPPKRKRIESTDTDDDEEEFDSKFSKEEIYDSDASDIDDTLTPARKMVLTFLQNAPLEELSCLPHCSKKKAESIVNERSFNGWRDLVTKFQNSKNLSTDLLSSVRDVLNSRKVITQLMRKCEILADELEHKVSCYTNPAMNSNDKKIQLKQQPSLLNSNYQLTPYQLLGLNWLVLMHKENVNGILADEMGLGKTIQAIAFLTYCFEQGNHGPFLVVAPSSTLGNWEREINTWCPALRVILYHGSQDYRRYLKGELLNVESRNYEILITTYNLVAGTGEDRAIFKKLTFEYVVFDEAHLLKNMETLRYQYLMRINAKRRLLLTGTPFQNNLVELMSLLGFLMPNMFERKIDHLKSIFSMASKGKSESNNSFEQERVDQAKRIMKPFVLRRQKCDVLKELPNKSDELTFCELSSRQKTLYDELVINLSKEVENNDGSCQGKSGSGMMMQLRKLANHPLLMRYEYSDKKLRKMAKLMKKEPTHYNSEEGLILEDMKVMSDFELHKLCAMYKSLSPYVLQSNVIMDSGKCHMLNELLPEMETKGDRVLLFSQFVIVLDVLEEYLTLKNYKYIRLDGSTPVDERQSLIDNFTDDHSIFVFLLSTKAGGLGINLVAANVVILHDIDFNPYNDKQAVDRCHRVGQKREVKILRLISKGTIEEGILKSAERKLKLEKALIDSENDNLDVATLLKEALNL